MVPLLAGCRPHSWRACSRNAARRSALPGGKSIYGEKFADENFTRKHTVPDSGYIYVGHGDAPERHGTHTREGVELQSP